MRTIAARRVKAPALAIAAALLLAGVAITACGSDRPTTEPISAPAVPAKGCGTMPGPGATFTIQAGSVGCAEARRVFTDLFAGRGRPQTSPGTNQTGTKVDGWLCGGGAGGFGCSKNGQTITAAA